MVCPSDDLISDPQFEVLDRRPGRIFGDRNDLIG
jgi:hypothetical protein